MKQKERKKLNLKAHLPGQLFSAIKKYISHLRVCTFADKTFNRTDDSSEIAILGQINTWLTKKSFIELAAALKAPAGTYIDFNNTGLAVQIKTLFRAVSEFEEMVYVTDEALEFTWKTYIESKKRKLTAYT